MKNLLLFLSAFWYSTYGLTQVDTLPVPSESQQEQDLLEDFLQSSEGDESFDFNTIFEQLEAFRQNPLNLNTAPESQLQLIPFLNDNQIFQLLQYRERYGALIAIEELQAIPGFDLTTIRRLLPYVNVTGSVDDYQASIFKMIAQGDNDLYVRGQRILETQKGFKTPEGPDASPPFLGDPYKLYIRYKHRYDNRLSYGFTAEKDQGEEFFKGSNKTGFDFYSAHFFMDRYSNTLKALAIGDYQASFGQGLILYSGFGRSKGINTMNIKRARQPLRAYSSVDENNFLRGAGATIGLGNHIEVTAFGSIRDRDANILLADTLDQEELLQRFSSLQNSGLHRTLNEIEDEDALRQYTVGASLAFAKNNFRMAVNGLLDRFDKTLNRRIQPYNKFQFNGQQLFNTSVDYSYIFRNLNFFGETAMSDNGSVATTNGLLMTLDRNIDFSLLYRHFPKDYQALNANPLAETSNANNETGFYLGTIIRLNRFWKLSAYFDTWRHPWLRFGVDAPSRGYEYRARLNYYLKRKLNVFIEVQNEIKERNSPDPDAKFDILVPVQILQARLQVNQQVNEGLELRSRVDFGWFDNGFNEEKLKGFVLYQDIILKPKSFPLSLTSRFALFDTDGYNIRFYAYENDLLYSYSVPPYFDKGYRFYINLRYRAFRNLTLEFRYAHTQWANLESISSGLNEIEGSRRREVKAQLHLSF